MMTFLIVLPRFSELDLILIYNSTIMVSMTKLMICYFVVLP